MPSGAGPTTSGPHGLAVFTHALTRVCPALDAVSVADALTLARMMATATAVAGNAPEPDDPDTATAPAGPERDRDAVEPTADYDGPPDDLRIGTALKVYDPANQGLPKDGISVGRGHARRQGSLPRPLETARALRPLKRRYPRGRDWALDVEATVESHIPGAPLVPVFHRRPERWFDLDIVLDGAPSMVMWESAAAELVGILCRLGAFRTIRRWRLAAQDDELRLFDARGRHASPTQVSGQTGRHLVVVLSDCFSPMWDHDQVWAMVLGWGNSASTLLLNPLPIRMWSQTGLVGPEVRVRAHRVGIASKQLVVSVLGGSSRFAAGDMTRMADRGAWAPLPVASLRPYTLAEWSSALMARGSGACAAILLGGADAVAAIGWFAAGSTPDVSPIPVSVATRAPEIDDDWPSSPAEQARSLVGSFRARSSTAARRLAALGSQNDKISLPLLELIQRVLLPSSDLDELAEVVYSELAEVALDNGGIPVMRFRPGVAELLRASLSRLDEWDLRVRVGVAIDRESRTSSARTLPTASPVSRGPEHIARDTSPAALVPAPVESALAALLGIQGRSGDDLDLISEDREWLISLTRNTQTNVEALTFWRVGDEPDGQYDFWDSDLGHRYLESESEAVGRGVHIRRVFFFDNPEAAEDRRFLNLCSLQTSRGIEVRHYLQEDHREDINSVEFTVFDSTVCFETTSTSIVDVGTKSRPLERTRILTTEDTRRLQQRFEEIWELAAAAPLTGPPPPLTDPAAGEIEAAFPGTRLGPHTIPENVTANDSRPEFIDRTTDDLLSDPIFFISYAAPDDGPYIRRFFQDLSTEVRVLSGIRNIEGIGFIAGKGYQIGEDHFQAQERATALSKCGTFVALCSPSYFASEICGREWSLFTDREHRATLPGRPQASALVPLIWTPLHQPPNALAQLQYDHSELGEEYAKFGLRYLLQLKRLHDDYQEFLVTLASRLVRLAQEQTLPTVPIPDYSTAHNAFVAPFPQSTPAPTTIIGTSTGEIGSHQQREREEARLSSRQAGGPRHVTFVLYAATASEIAPLRDGTSRYDRDVDGWSPFHPRDTRRIGSIAAGVAAELNFTSTILDGAYTALPELLDQARSRNEPTMILIDPWTALLEPYRRQLAALDIRNEPTVGIVVVWSNDDEESVSQSDQLMQNLALAMPNNLIRQDKLLSLTKTDPESLRVVLQRTLVDAQARILNRGNLFRRFTGSARPARPPSE